MWPLDGIRSGFEFESPVREAILALKFANLRSVGSTLSAYMAGTLRGDGLEFDVLTPVPLHKRRMRERGYNQSEILAVGLGKEMGIEVDGAMPATRDISRAPSQGLDCRREAS